jgi:hypothetical protein
LVDDFKVDLKAPLEVDFDIGLHWGTLKSWDGTKGDMRRIQLELLGRKPPKPTKRIPKPMHTGERSGKTKPHTKSERSKFNIKRVRDGN